MKIVINDQLVNYSDQGQGKVLLMLHGWGSRLETFDELALALAKNYRVIRLDFPGFGGSPRPQNDWTIEDYAKFIDAFLDKLKVIDMYAVIAHSFGGRVAIKMLGTNIRTTQKLVLIGSGGIKHSSSLRQQAYKTVAKTGKQILKLPGLKRAHSAVRRQLYKTAGASDYVESGELKAIFLNAINEDLRDTAANISLPSLLLWGSDDDQAPVSDAKIFHEKIRSSKLVIYPNTGHFTHTEKPAVVLQEIEDFLAS